MRPGRLTRLLGRVTGPALILLIVTVVGASVAGLAGAPEPPAATPAAPYDDAPAVQGFLTGYQTMDLLASLTFGIVIATNVRSLGVTERGGVMREVCRAGAIAGVLMVAVYGASRWWGSSRAGPLAGATNGAAVITAAATAHFGVAGTVVVAAIFLLALPQRLHRPHQLLRLLLCRGAATRELPRLRACLCRLPPARSPTSGLDAILSLSATLLGCLYPVAIVLVALGMLRGLVDGAPARLALDRGRCRRRERGAGRASGARSAPAARSRLPMSGSPG